VKKLMKLFKRNKLKCPECKTKIKEDMMTKFVSCGYCSEECYDKVMDNELHNKVLMQFELLKKLKNCESKDIPNYESDRKALELSNELQMWVNNKNIKLQEMCVEWGNKDERREG